MFSQTSQLLQIQAANNNSHPRYGVDINNKLFFVSGKTYQQSFWKSDGTSVGTTVIAAASGTGPSPQFNNIKTIFPFGTKALLIAAPTAASFDQELWVSDGTSAGTFRLADIYPGSSGSNISNIKVVTFGGVTKALFSAYSPTDGQELWITDGTIAGTQLLKNINSSSASSNPFGFEQLGTNVLFFANDGTNGIELWKTDGTTAGTVLLKDIYSGITNSVDQGISKIIALGTYAFLNVKDGTNGVNFALYRTDGTTAGTQTLGPSYPNPANLTAFNNKLFFTNNYGSYTNLLYVDDGTGFPIFVNYYTGGTNVLNAEQLTPTANRLYLISKWLNGEARLYCIESYAPSLARDTRDINTGTADPFPIDASKRKLTPTDNDKVYFFANDGTSGTELWISGGDYVSTNRVTDAVSGSNGGDYSYLKTVGSRLFFVVNNASNQYDCYQTNDGATPTLVKNYTPALNISNLYPIAKVGSYLYFSAYNATSGYELYRTDGTTNSLVKDIETSVFNTNNSNFHPTINATNSQGLFFISNDGKNGLELWKTNGKQTGTSLFFEFNKYPTPEGLSAPNTSYDYYTTSTVFVNMYAYNDKIYIVTSDGVWVTDGINPPTKLITNYKLTNAATNFFNVMGGLVYFTVVNELWKTDGTVAGTTRIGVVDPLYEGDYNSIVGLELVNNKLYFLGYHYTYGQELFVSDGATISLVKDAQTGNNSASDLNKIRRVGNNLYYVLYNNSTGFELYKSDGTSVNTTLLKTFGFDSYAPSYLSNFNDTHLVFSGGDLTTGEELWKSDGTAVGTVMVKDIFPGNDSSSPINNTNRGQFSFYNGNVLFTANKGSGRGLFKSDLTAAGTDSVTSISTFDALATNTGVYFTTSFPSTGNEPYKVETDGASVRNVGDVIAGSSNSNPINMVASNGLIYMKTYDASFREFIHVFKMCKNEEVLSGTITSNSTTEAIDAVKTSAIVNSSITQNLLAKKYIQLNPGFRTSTNTIFSAKIGGCVYSTTTP
ncbi:hypothetical protein GCM10011514_52410 [Emticicia aquatilis]|uniref:ELWxxDGT repeat protein n=1 Tax=Emticicia aquatilis TaxID=1537369 RepID=A0A916Z9Q9_9BACT|nr:hypothetical protein GCM10011514_52410 [Emticicia aquatilis]